MKSFLITFIFVTTPCFGVITNCNIGFVGDSLTFGSFSTGGGDYPTVMMGLPNVAVSNTKVVSAAPGRQISNASFNYTAEMHPSSPIVTGKCGYIFVMIGINDVINDSSAVTIEAQLTTFWSVIKTDGWTLIPMTMTPTGESTARENVRIAVNSWISTQGSSWDLLLDTESVFTGPGILPTNTLYYYTDQIHFINAGYSLIAYAANQLIFGPLYPPTRISGNVVIGSKIVIQ